MVSEAVALQRVDAEARIAFRRRGARTVLADLQARGGARLLLPRATPDGWTEAVLVNTAGGLTGGDRLTLAATLHDGADARLTTQAAEKIYRSIDGPAVLRNSLSLGPGSRAEWLPQETILFDGAALDRRLDVDLAPDAQLLAVEAAILGRTARGERVAQGSLRDSWRVRRTSRLLFADSIRLEGEIARHAAGPATLRGACAFATVLYVAPDAAARLEPLWQALTDLGGIEAGASLVSGLLVARVVASDGLALRRALVPALARLRDGRPAPRLWTC